MTASNGIHSGNRPQNGDNPDGVRWSPPHPDGYPMLLSQHHQPQYHFLPYVAGEMNRGCYDNAAPRQSNGRQFGWYIADADVLLNVSLLN